MRKIIINLLLTLLLFSCNIKGKGKSNLIENTNAQTQSDNAQTKSDSSQKQVSNIQIQANTDQTQSDNDQTQKGNKDPEICFNAKKTSDNEDTYNDITKYTNQISLKVVLTEDGIIIYEGIKDKGSEASRKLFKVEKDKLENFKNQIENPNYAFFNVIDLSNNTGDVKITRIETNKDNDKYIILRPQYYKDKKNTDKAPFYTFEVSEDIKKWLNTNIK